MHLAVFGLRFTTTEVIKCLIVFADAEHLNAVALCFEMAALSADHMLRLALLIHDLAQALRHVVDGVAGLRREEVFGQIYHF